MLLSLTNYIYSSAPRGIVNHYFDVGLYAWICGADADNLATQETIGSESEFGDDAISMMSADLNTLGDISPDAL
jgi:hypothetical protein